jgi:hypothetical protein
VPYLELDDGRTIVATDGADEIAVPAGASREFQATWRRWAQIGAKAGQLVDPGLTSQVRWALGDDRLSRRETLTAARSITIRRWRVVVPTTASVAEEGADGTSLHGARQSLAVSVSAPWPMERRLRATGDTAAGRGARGHIPLHLSYESRDIHLTAGQALTWQMSLRVKEEGP